MHRCNKRATRMKNRVVGLLRAALSQCLRFVLMSIFLSTPPPLVTPSHKWGFGNISRANSLSLFLSLSLSLFRSLARPLFLFHLEFFFPSPPCPNHPSLSLSLNRPLSDYILRTPCPACKTLREFQLELSELDRLNSNAEWWHYPSWWNQRTQELRGHCRTFPCTALVIESVATIRFIETDATYLLKCVFQTTLHHSHDWNRNPISLHDLRLIYH